MSVRLAPVKAKALVSKPAIRSKIQILELAEVVPIQLKQVSQDRLLLWSSGDNFDMRGSLSCAFCHSRNVIRWAKISSKTIVGVVFGVPLVSCRKQAFDVRWDEFCMAHSATTIHENGFCWQQVLFLLPSCLCPRAFCIGVPGIRLDRNDKDLRRCGLDDDNSKLASTVVWIA